MKVTLILDIEEACKRPGTYSGYMSTCCLFTLRAAHGITPLLGFSDLNKAVGNSLETINVTQSEYILNCLLVPTRTVLRNHTTPGWKGLQRSSGPAFLDKSKV